MDVVDGRFVRTLDLKQGLLHSTLAVTLMFFLLFAAGLPAGADLAVKAPCFDARFERGCLVQLSDKAGDLVKPPAQNTGAGIHRLDADHWARFAKTLQAFDAHGPGSEEYGQLTGLEGGTINATYEQDSASGDLIVMQHATSPENGVWGVEWSIASIPLDFNILIPGHSGLKLSRTSPMVSERFDYPMAWEAQLVVVEGKDRGFYVWAEDAKGEFKRLTVQRGSDGWRLGFITMPYAPFEPQTACGGIRWRLNVYEGDWRVAARRYRDWADQALHPAPVSEQQPAWLRDIRCCVILGLDLNVLDALPRRLDPAQTLLYVPGWRKAGYDRDYPTYDQPVDELEPFVRRAHALGFRVMLHVNYFGCDPLNPAYPEFEPYQVRNPWGGHDKEWWLWTRDVDPIIKFAYINPAHKPWRDLLVARLAALCNTRHIDALHLDQTLCIYNDYNGLMDGQSMIDGNVALHRELREALPNVALSGEGLNEVTYRHEAFAQRHVLGINHSDGTYNLRQLAMAHPISSYLLRPYVTIYGYLGCAPPTDGPLYAAWNDAYMRYGVIPTLKPALAELDRPTGFSAQFFDEARFWLGRRVDVDPDAAWPADVAFPFRTSDGKPVVRTLDRRLVCEGQEISRTVYGVANVETKGSIPDWRVYDDGRILALDPARWYPCVSAPRDASAFHVTSPFPEGFTVDAVASCPRLAFVRSRPAGNSQLLLAEMLGSAHCGTRLFSGKETEVAGELHGDDGGQFIGAGDAIHAHPPYKTGGSGIAFARFALTIPKDAVRFIAEVGLDSGATGEGRSDGVTFGATLHGDGHAIHAETHNATADRQALVLDVKPSAGSAATLELTVDPGPAHNPSYDWARWYRPRIERAPAATAEVTIVEAEPWAVALSGRNAVQLEPAARTWTVAASFPGAVYLLRARPEAIALSCALTAVRHETTFLSESGTVLDTPPHASAEPGESTVAEVLRSGLFAHPPSHGMTQMDFPMTLPEPPALFHAFLGIRDGSKSSGVVFRVQMNGEELHRQGMLPGAWSEIACDLSPWAGQPAVLTLITDSDGDFNFDWAQWGEPEIRAK